MGVGVEVEVVFVGCGGGCARRRLVRRGAGVQPEFRSSSLGVEEGEVGCRLLLRSASMKRKPWREGSGLLHGSIIRVLNSGIGVKC